MDLLVMWKVLGRLTILYIIVFIVSLCVFPFNAENALFEFSLPSEDQCKDALLIYFALTLGVFLKNKHLCKLGEYFYKNLVNYQNIGISFALVGFILLIDSYAEKFLSLNYFYLFEYTVNSIVSLWVAIYLLTFIGRKTLIALCLLFAIVSICQIAHFSYFKTSIQPMSLILLVEHPYDVYVSLMPVIMDLLLQIVPLILIFCFSILVVYQSRNLQFNFFCTFFLLIFSISSLWGKKLDLTPNNSGKITHTYSKKHLPGNHNTEFKNAYNSLSYMVLRILPSVLRDDNHNFPEIKPPLPVLRSKTENIVLIIGESLRASQLDILGYHLNTTPYLSNRKNLVYKEIYSAGTMTKTSIPAIINRGRYPNIWRQIQSSKNCLFRLAKDAGYTTHFVSAQSIRSFDIIEPLICKDQIDNLAYRESLGAASKHDYSLIEYMNRVDLSSNNNLIVLHMNGSHSPYSSKYPSDYEIFDHPYDNTVLYTDFVVNGLLELFDSKTNGNFEMVFTSDHGELLTMDALPALGHGYFYEQVYKVPLVAYTKNVESRRELESVRSHFELSNWIITKLGYVINDRFEDVDTGYVNGSDIGGLGGYLKVDLNASVMDYSDIQY